VISGMQRCKCSDNGANGFTLIELLIALAIVGILSALAWPGYTAVLQRAQRNDAKLALLALQFHQERHYLQHFAYADNLIAPPAEGGLGTGTRSASGAYVLSVTLLDQGQRYLATAVPTRSARQAGDRACAAFTINEAGQRGATDAAGADATTTCWK
jgi:type IV pilus assembly protein PilE